MEGIEMSSHATKSLAHRNVLIFGDDNFKFDYYSFNTVQVRKVWNQRGHLSPPFPTLAKEG
jgi:hypothetical protein